VARASAQRPTLIRHRLTQPRNSHPESAIDGVGRVTPTAVYPVTVQVAACTREAYRGKPPVSRGPSDYRRPQGRQAGVRGSVPGGHYPLTTRALA
jgi:hypothetical protein